MGISAQVLSAWDDDLAGMSLFSDLKSLTIPLSACDASLLRVLENEHGEPLDVGRKTRTIPPAIRRALNTRDGGCRFPGCTHQRYVDAHHIEHWADGGK